MIRRILDISLNGNEIYDIAPLGRPVATDDLETVIRPRVAGMESVVSQQGVVISELQKEIQALSVEYQNVLGRYHELLDERDALRVQLAQSRSIWARLADRLSRWSQG